MKLAGYTTRREYSKDQDGNLCASEGGFTIATKIMRNSPDYLILSLRCVGIMLCVGAQLALAQAGALGSNENQSAISLTKEKVGTSAAHAAVSLPEISSALVIGSGDELEIGVYGAPDLSAHTRVNESGSIFLPLVGSVTIAGLTSDGAQRAISDQLRERNIINNPQVSVYVKEYRNRQITVAGEVARPGLFSALGPHRLLDVLEAAGGLTEKAGTTVTIAHLGTDRLISMRLLNDATEMAHNNIELLPGDTVLVPKAEIVFVLGEVNKPGGYALNSSGGVTVLQVVSAAGGPTRLASISGAKIVRHTPAGLKEIPLPLKALLRAKASDIPVEAGDVLYIPSSRVKASLNAGALLSSAGTAAIYRFP